MNHESFSGPLQQIEVITQFMFCIDTLLADDEFCML